MNFQSIIRGMTQNHAELNDKADDPTLRPIRSTGSPSEVADRITDWVNTQSNWQIISRDSPNESGEIALHLTRTTGLFQFVDDIHVRVVDDDNRGASRIEAESQSRVGKGDLGQNARNLRELTGAFR
ncbi:DUF1499 domain-containing protein [Rubripirellula reticaptiva]|nr:DUF1499 domain-containing protein [Rubripirellula reticaptiva]